MRGMTSPKYCHSCGHDLPPSAKFCPECGTKLAEVRRPLGVKDVTKVLLVGLGLFGFGWATQSSLAGKKPERPFETASAGHAPGGGHTLPAQTDPEIKSLRAAAEADRGNKEPWRALVTALYERLQKEEDPVKSGLIFEIIDGLRAILEIDPKDKDALLAMADVSFNQQAFSKAADFYKAYLEVEPKDVSTRARYASSLTFLGRYDDSVSELERAIAEDPKNFSAFAYLAITYAQMGKTQDAIAMGDKVLALAPDDEARARFSKFIDSVKEKASSGKTVEGGHEGHDHLHDHDHPHEHDAAEAKAPRAEPEKVAIFASPIQQVIDHVKANSVAGPKLSEAKFDENSGTLTFLFRSFPMQAMPPFVRDKFVNGVKEKASTASGIKTVVFADAESGSEMQRVEVR